MLSFLKRMRTDSESDSRIKSIRSQVVTLDDVFHSSILDLGIYLIFKIKLKLNAFLNVKC